MPEKRTDLLQGTVDMLILKNDGPGTYARIRHFRPNGTSEQGRFPAQSRILISRDSTITEGWANRGRMEADREQPASEVLHPDAEGTKEA